MELKVWVDGVVRVVCGLSLNTSCQDVVISLAQAIGQTGRYVLVRKFRGLERPLAPEDCPVQLLAYMGQLAAEVHFILRRTGPSLSEGPHKPSKQNHPPLVVPSEPELFNHKAPQKSLTFNLGPSTLPRRTKRSRNWSPTLGESAEVQTSSDTFQDHPNPPSDPHKEEMFREILQQQKMLQDLEVQIEALEKETDLWDQKVTSSPDPLPHLTEDLQELEYRLKQCEVELMYGENWEEELKVELEREQEMQRRLQQIHSSIEDQSYEIKVLQSRSDHLEQDVQGRTQTNSAEEEEARQTDQALRSLTQELHNRLRLGEDLDAALADTQWKLQTAEETVKVRLEMIDGLSKELRQCDLKQFIQQAGVNPYADQVAPLPVNEV
ncbi:ras association domain-containing protein 7-like isoform 1-T1 [Fundulus diaphanus]